MALRFRLRGLAETFIEEVTCPGCGAVGNDDQQFDTELTRVTLEGIVAVVQCRQCNEIFVPQVQRVGIVNPQELRDAVQRDSFETGEPIMQGIEAVRVVAERLNAERKGGVH